MDEITKQLTHDRHTYKHNGHPITALKAVETTHGTIESFYPSGVPEFVEVYERGFLREQTRFLENGTVDFSEKYERVLVTPAMCNKRRRERLALDTPYTGVGYAGRANNKRGAL